MSHSTNSQITRELIQVAGFYSASGRATLEVLQKLNLDIYTEIVLGESGFEVIVGGVGREHQLINLAGEMDFPRPVVEAFERFAGRFSQKMLYTKLTFGLSPHPSMYFCLIEPWEPVLQVLEALPGMKPAIPALKSRVAGSPICFLLGFTLDGPSGNLIAKTYFLADRKGRDASSPTLVSHRLGFGQLSHAVKYYTMGVGWKDFEINARWRQIAAFTRSIYGEDYALMKGHSQSPAGDEVKLYIFRNDIRENASLATYNFYYDEGMRLLQLNRYSDASNSFTNAIEFQTENAHAYNNRGFCYIQLNDYARALPDCQKAITLDPQISTNNLNFVLEHQNSEEL